MTKKELDAITLGYRELARKCLTEDAPYAMIVGICEAIAENPYASNSECGKKLRAFFQALDDVKKES